MAVKIRLKRMGAKKNPFYRIVVADSRTPRDGRALEELGYYDPVKNPAEVKIDVEAAKKWLKNGAQPSDTVRDLMKKYGAFGENPTAGPESKPAAEPVTEPVKEQEAEQEIEQEAGQDKDAVQEVIE